MVYTSRGFTRKIKTPLCTTIFLVSFLLILSFFLLIVACRSLLQEFDLGFTRKIRYYS